jgi:hypothetical protein
VVLLVLGWVAAAPGRAPAAAANAEAENASRLRSMPREERLALWEKLREFDALGPAEHSAIRSLNEQISQLPPDEQANYQSVLRSYHRWVQGLSEEQRNELSAVPPNERMRLVTRLRAQERTSPAASHLPLPLQVLDFTAQTPFETAVRIKTWLELSPEKRAEIEQLDSPPEQQRRLADVAQFVRLAQPARITKAEEDALVAKIEANPQWKNSPLNPLKKADSAKQEKVRRRIAASYHFLEKPPAAVESARLMRFQAALPPWYRGQYDHLPPEEARRRLTILYRLIFPAPGEMPETSKPAQPPEAAPTPATPGSVPQPPRPGTGPF